VRGVDREGKTSSKKRREGDPGRSRVRNRANEERKIKIPPEDLITDLGKEEERL